MDRSTERVFQDVNAVQFGRGIARRSRAALGFLPAFFDFATATVYRSRFADGRLAPYHILDGLPEPLVASRDLQGRVTSVKCTLIPGFERNGYFYTHAAVHRAVEEWSDSPA